MNPDPYPKHQRVETQALNDMDYSYFTAAPQPYQFMGLPPTPSHTNNVNSEEFNASSPQNSYDFQAFDVYNHYNAAGVPEPPTPQSQPRTSTAPLSTDGADTNMDTNGDQNRQGSNSDDEDMTPAKARRKAQNRAAQRAFRERKEQHVKELEAQVAALKQTANSVSTENELLKISLRKISTENEILKATATHASHSPHSSSPNLPDTTGPMRFSPKDFYSEVLYGHENKVPSHRIVVDEKSGSKLLGAGATWDFILASEQFQRGVVDIGAVAENLKKMAKCDGQGPVFEERAILAAIEQSVASGSDELM